MSWLGDAGRALWGGTKKVARVGAAIGTGGLSEVAIDGGKKLFGSGGDPGVLGTGQFQVNAPQVNMTAGNLPGAQVYRDQAAQQQQMVQGRPTPMVQGAQLNTTRADEARGGQQQLAADLLAASRGQGPSVAQEQLRQGAEKNLAGAVALTNSTRGMGGAAAAGQLQAARAQVGQQMASDAALLRAQEVTQARGQLGGVLGDVRQADLATASQQAQLEQQAGLANQQASLEDQARKDQLTREYIAMGFDFAQAEAQAAMEMERLRVDAQLESERIRQGAYEGAAGRRMRTVENVANAIGQAAGAGAGGAGGAKPPMGGR
jgi:hypothetical protein